MIFELHFTNCCLYYVPIFGLFSTYCFKNSVKNCLKDCCGKGLHALSWTVTCMETIRDITFEFIGFRFFLTGWTLWLLLLWMHIGLVSTLWNFVEIQTYHTLTLIRHLCNTNLMKSPWDQHDLHIRHVITSKLPSFMVTSYARSWENVVWLLFDFVW